MNKFLTATAAVMLAAPAFAEGDAAAGERDFNRCKSCHMIVADDGAEIVRGGRTGPNLYGIIGSQAGSVDGFRYGNDLVAVGESGFVWTEEELAAYVLDPKGWLEEKLGKSARSSMAAQRLRTPEDVAAYLATFSAAEDDAEG